VTKLKTKLPDTNTILRYLLKDHEDLHSKAAAFFEDVRTGKENALILESVVVECVYVLTKYYRVPRGETAAILSRLLGYKGVANSDRKELTDALTVFSESKMDIVDCVLFAKARNYGLILYTFDKELAARMGDRG
jgi:predicted nucleic-acid-binding protein